MIKELQKFVDFMSVQCVDSRFKPIVQEEGSVIGEYLGYMSMDGEYLHMDHHDIPIEDIVSLEYGYYEDDNPNIIDKKYVNTVDEVDKWLLKKRSYYTKYFPYNVPYGFPLYEVDKIGCGFVTVILKGYGFTVYLPTKRISFEKDYFKENVENDESGKN